MAKVTAEELIGESRVRKVLAGSVIAGSMAFVQSLAASEVELESLTISGAIDTSFDEISSEGLSVTINGAAAEVSVDGGFTADVEVAPYYQLKVTGAAIHTQVQTFGISELYQSLCNCLQAPSVSVVARKEGRIELFFAGDAMAGRRYIEPIWGERQLIDQTDPLSDIVELLEPMRPYIEPADLASVNLEIVLSDQDFGNSPPKSVTFYAPPELATALRQVGFDHVSLGNNHSYDFLEEGLKVTIDAVEAAGLAWSGAGHNEEQALKASQLEIGGQPLSLLGYVGWKGRVEPNQVAEANKGGAAYGSDENVASSVAREAALGRAVIAQYHGSSEYSDEPSEDSERRMKLAIDNGAALIASHHPHVPHGLELYGSGLIAYSTGNFLFDQYFLETHGSFVLKAWMEEGRVIRAEVVPIRVLDYRPVPAVGSMREAVLDRVARLSARRGTFISRSGGHGVIVPEGNHGFASPARVSPCGAGQDLLRSGDFENALYGTGEDRSLKADRAKMRFRNFGKAGHVLELKPYADAAQVKVSPSTFFRNTGGANFTLCGMIYAESDVSLSAAWQIRGDGKGRMDALENAEIVSGQGAQDIAGGGWRPFSLDFRIDDESRGEPMRPFITLTSPNDPMPSQIMLDNLAILMRD